MSFCCGSQNIDELVENRRAAHAWGHGFVFGTPGSGKTSVVKEQIQSILKNSEDTVVVLDKEGSYRDFVREMNGQAVLVGGDAGALANPLDLVNIHSYAEEFPVELKVDFVIGLLEELCGEELTPRQESMVDRCVKKVYAPFFASIDVITGKYEEQALPTLAALYDLFCGVEDEDARLMAAVLYPLVKGSYKNILGDQPCIQHEKRLVVYDFRDVPWTIMGAVMMSVLESVRGREIFGGRAARGTDKRIWLYIDDAFPLLRSEGALFFLRCFYKRVHYYGCIMTAVSQDVSGLLGWDVGRAMLGNADYVHLLRLTPTDKKKLSEIFNLTDVDLAAAR